MSAKYFYTVKGARQGPTTLDELKSLAGREELKRSDLVWTEGMGAWQPAGTAAEIFQGLPPDLEPGITTNNMAAAATPPPLPAATSPPLTPTQTAAASQSNSHFSWYLQVLKKYAVFDGRATRREFWSFFFVNMAISFGLSIIDDLIEGNPGVLYFLYSFFFMIPFIAVGIRRMHDTDRSGWWILLPIGNLMCWSEVSKPGTNRFGPNPKTGTT